MRYLKLLMKNLKKKNLKKKSLLIFIVVATLLVLFILSKKVGLETKRIETGFLTSTPSPTFSQQSASFSQITPKISQRIYISGVSVKNFYQLAEVDFSKTYELASNERYRITFVPQKNLFFVVIYSSPFSSVRKEAETELVNLLDVEEKDACLLSVQIVTSLKVNPEYAGEYHPLSFCQK